MNPRITFKRKCLWSLFNKNCRVKPHIWLTVILPKHFVMPIGLNSPKLYKYSITLLLTTFLMSSLQLTPLGLKHKQMPCVWQGWQQWFSRCCCSHWLRALLRSSLAGDIGSSQVRAPKYKTSVLSTSHKIYSCYNRWWPSKKVTRKNPKIMMLDEKYFSSQEKVELPCKGSSELLRKLLIAKDTSRSRGKWPFNVSEYSKIKINEFKQYIFRKIIKKC